MSKNYNFNKRQDWLSLLAIAPSDMVEAGWASLDLAPQYTRLRAPQIGSVMVQGRQGGTGAPFNLGEVTVTRASVTLADGRVGHGYVQGRATDRAERCALLDALMQGDEAPRIETAILRPVAQALAAKRDDVAAKAAATKVEFFTMARGED